jgi:phosphoribosylformimino-5-aminoimidazole carboxamide ribonucleotide (ProFAR) isomerase
MKIVPYVSIETRSPLQRNPLRSTAFRTASSLSPKHDKLYLADFDGIFKNKPQLDIAQRICDELPTLYEGGIRYSNNVIDMLITGAERAVVGTSTLLDFSELKGAFKLSENITFKVDFRDGIVSFDPDVAGRAISDLFRDVAEVGVADVVVPVALVDEANKARLEHGFTLGVIAPASERTRLEKLGVDYMVTEDYGSLMPDE